MLNDFSENLFDPQQDEDFLNLCNSTKLTERSSKDLKVNPMGRPFLEFIMNNGLTILNGRTLGDIFGEITCVQYNGCSLVDYVCVSSNIIEDVQSLNIGNISYLSDHRPVTVSIGLDCLNKLFEDVPVNYENAPLGYKWISGPQSSKAQFMKQQLDINTANKINNMDSKVINNSDDVHALNADITNLYCNISDQVLARKKVPNRNNKKKWFDWECRKAKRQLNNAEHKVNKNPLDTELRTLYHNKKKEYRKIKSKKKNEFLFGLNQQIEDGKTINWKSFKKLKAEFNEPVPFDTYDLNNFFCFFKELYSRKCKKSDHGENNNTNRYNRVLSEEEDMLLNKPITLDEVNSTIKQLKLNKSPSADLIINEMLKNSSNDLRRLLVKLFNGCLTHGVYPWNVSITTPLHKKGNKEDPDNYRAIIIGSCLGKLFSTILLRRLIEFRQIACPDQPNQLGFCTGSQTSDHILVLKTILDKYVKKSKARVYSCFVDYKKAFDSVCRQALLHKVCQLGIGGNFFKCLENMYNGSITKIKLVNKLSAAINIEIGTEQGHPLSPELFKVFINDLSIQLNELSDVAAPVLNNCPVNHLLWADDLVLLALDLKSLQKLLNCLDNYVQLWELEVNIDKTNIMIFNTLGRLLKESYSCHLGSKRLKPVKEYCYLGIVFSLNGSFKSAIKNLVAKAKRSFFQIKRTVDTRALTIRSLITIFDTLVLPIITYGSQIWIPNTSAGKIFSNNNANQSDVDRINSFAKDVFETFNLHYLKWILGLHKRTSNIPVYGDTGRLPLAIKIIPQCVKYFKRVEAKSLNESTSIVGHAFKEQELNDFEWFKTWNVISQSANTPELCKSVQVNLFKSSWESKRMSLSKMKFYNSVKTSFGLESFLSLSDYRSRKAVSRLRSSAHDLNIEVGRYKKMKGESTADKACRQCCNKEAIQDLQHLPDFQTIPEDEAHVLTTCPLYHELRLSLTDDLKCHLMLKQYGYAMSDLPLCKELGLFLYRCYKIRNPKD